jgi:hypothetical protein
MMTFLPYPDFAKSVKCLDMRRLGKQRAEVYGLLRSFEMDPEQDKKLGFRDPNKWMWWGHFNQLIEYGIVACDEWLSRGYKDTCREKIAAYKDVFSKNNELPFWFGNAKVHYSHQCVLLKKDPEHYAKHFPFADTNMGYVWPDCRHNFYWYK